MGSLARPVTRLAERLGRWVGPVSLVIALHLSGSVAVAQGPPPFSRDESSARDWPALRDRQPRILPYGPALPDRQAQSRPYESDRQAQGLTNESVVGESMSAEEFYQQLTPRPAQAEPALRQGYLPPAAEFHSTIPAPEPWTMQWLPEGLIYRSYLAGDKEPRLGGTVVHEVNEGWLIEATAGARVAAFRYGTTDGQRPEGLELDCEGAAFPRMATDSDRTMISTDFRIGFPLTYGIGPYQTKLAVYHLSSHLGDEFMIENPGFPRVNYSRNALVWGNSYFVDEDVRLYAEAEWAWYNDGGSKPWAFQFGAEYSPMRPLGSLRGAPFLAVNGHLRQEVDFGGNFVLQTGWQWRGQSGHLCRLGMQYVTGPSDQFEFFRRFEDRLGVGMWYDF